MNEQICEIVTEDGWSGAAPSAIKGGYRFLLETFVCDLTWSFMEAATLAVTVCACARRETAWTMWDWRHLLTEDGANIKLALRHADELGLPAAVINRISRFYDELTTEKQILKLPAAVRRAYAPMERRELETIYQRLARTIEPALELCVFVQPFVEYQLGSPYVDDLLTIGRFMREAAAGGGPHIDAIGRIRIPSLSQRRRTPRAIKHLACHIDYQGATIPAMIEDVSRGGLGLVCSQSIAVGSCIVLALDDGRRLAAEVRRSNGDRMGVAFDELLPLTDPLFVGIGIPT